jgi:hypothetical protein
MIQPRMVSKNPHPPLACGAEDQVASQAKPIPPSSPHPPPVKRTDKKTTRKTKLTHKPPSSQGPTKLSPVAKIMKFVARTRRRLTGSVGCISGRLCWRIS